MYISKQSFKYQTPIFELDMQKRGITIDITSEKIGPYTSGEDVFKYFLDNENKNPIIKAHDKIELTYINQGLNKTIELSNDKYEAIITFTTDSRQIHENFHIYRCIASLNKHNTEGSALARQLGETLQSYFIIKDIISPKDYILQILPV